MFDNFFHETETELGPLNSNWFKVLSERASEAECGNFSDAEHDILAQKDEGVFRAPAQMPVMDSQMCSTPKIFSRRRSQSPALGCQDSPNSVIQNLFPVPATSNESPRLFDLSKDRDQFEQLLGSLKSSTCFGVLDTPTGLMSQALSAQRISESLGAQLNPDLSWRSSFNTPSSLSPTVILSQREVPCSPVSFYRDKDVIIVRKLFPSLSKGTDSTSASASCLKNNDGNVQAEVQKSDSSSENMEAVWRQTVPEAIKEDNVRDTVESVINGAEDVLSFFFTNSSSALRRVKAKERKKRTNGASKDVKADAVTVDSTTVPTSSSRVDSSTAVITLRSPLFSSQITTKDFTQWTPLNLSDIQDYKTHQVCISEPLSKCTSPHIDDSVRHQEHNNSITQHEPSSSCTTEQQKASPNSCHEKSQGRRSLVAASPVLTFSRKRKFVYRVQNSERKRVDTVADVMPGKEDAHTDTGDHVIQPVGATVKQDHPAGLNVDHDFDMTQLCKAFAEDFTQEVNSLQSAHKSAQNSRDSVLMPTCSMKEKSKVQPEKKPVVSCDGYVDQQATEIINFSNIQPVKSTICDSGCPAGVCSFNLGTPPCDSAELHSGFKTANNKIVIIPPEAVIKAKAALDESIQPVTPMGTSSVAGTNHFRPVKASPAGEKFPSESFQHGCETGTESCDESMFRSEAVGENILNSSLCQTSDSGFKTASNKSITVSCVNLEKANDIFREFHDQTFDSHQSNNELLGHSLNEAKLSKLDLTNSRKPLQSSAGYDDGSSSSPLTASQKADVSELCSMFEEASSQYEFTQYKHTKISSKYPSSVPAEKDWDPEILAGIDFDDSFNNDLPQRQVSKKHQSKFHESVPDTLNNGDVSIQRIRKSCDTLAEMPAVASDNLQRTSLCPGFKTAKGNAVTISEKSLSKARSIFADIEDTVVNNGLGVDCKADTVLQKAEPSGDLQDWSCRVTIDSESGFEQNSQSKEDEANLNTRQRGAGDQKSSLIRSNVGFFTAGGKEVKISVEALQKAKKLLNEVANDKESEPADPLWTSRHNSSNVLTDVPLDSGTYDGSLPECREEQRFESGAEIEQTVYPTAGSVESSGFRMASGKGVSVSASAVQKSKRIFENLDDSVRSHAETTSEEENANPNLEGDTSQHAFVNGFKMASGKGVSFSEEAFLKAKMFFNGRDPDRVEISQVKGDDISVMDDCGFEGIAGNMVHSPGMDSLDKETLKKDSSDLNKYLQRKFIETSIETLQAPSVCGFSAASGAEVSVSTEALQKANAMLDDSNAASPAERRVERSDQKSFSSKNETVISGKICGFSTASGRKVAISEKALQEARNLFTDCEVDGLGSDPGHLSDAKSSTPGHIQLTFNAAPNHNKNISVSEKKPNKAEDVSPSRGDVSLDTESQLTTQPGPQEIDSTGSLNTKNESVPTNAGKSDGGHENMMNRGPKADQLAMGNFGFSTASGKGVHVSNSALEVASEMFRDCHAQQVIDRQSKITSDGSATNMNKTPVVSQPKATFSSLPSQATQNHPSLLSRHSLNLEGCTVTQQKYFEQEAMACTKALLEDDLSESRLLCSLDTDTRQSPPGRQGNCVDLGAGGGKRTSADSNLAGQPPFKRRLMSGFDHCAEDRAACAAVKSSPSGTLIDRRVSKYNLKPNITFPSSNVANQTSANLLKWKQSEPKCPVFTPPFRKDFKAETPKNCVLKPMAQIPSVFVPPFKRKYTFGSVHMKDSSQISGCPTSSNGNSTSHTTRKPEDQNTETETKRGETLENPNTIPCETKVFWEQSLRLALDMQDMRIRKKQRQRVRPLPGTFYLAKTSGVSRISLKEAVRYKCPELHTEEQLYQHGVSVKVSQVTSENAETFRFSCDEFFKREVLRETGGVQLADGGWLIPDNEGMMGKEEFCRALCDTPGVDPKLISEAWVYNHYRWIVWKRASMEKSFPEVMGGRCLTPEQVLLQLKLRYDVEVDHSRRSALKKIMERDDTPAKTIVLCICGITKRQPSSVSSEGAMDTADKKPESSAAVVWLTDGWYSIKALLDVPLSAMLRNGRLRVGGKLVIHAAELIGSQDACTPLEAPESLMLKISANSTRRARWDAKLGFYKDPRPFPLLLSSLCANGGVVSCVDIVVLRSYPTQWMEKKPGSVYVFRNERAEDREAERHNSTKQKAMELLFSKIQAQIEKEEEDKKKTRKSRTFSLQEIKSLQEGEELYEVMESDSTFVEAHLSTQQVKALSSYRRALTERKRAEVQERVHKAVQETEGPCANRDVTPVWKLSIADSNDLHSSRVYTLNIWRPSVELYSLLREGCRYKVYHLATSEVKKRAGTSNIQVTATKKTQFQDIKVCRESLSLHFPARQSVKFRDLQSPGFSSPCGEVDIVGYCISIMDRQGTSPVLYFVDEKFDFVSVRICSSLTLLALEDLVKPLALLAASNLQLRQHSGPVPSLYAGEHALFSTNTKEGHLQEEISRLKTFVEDYEHFFIVAEEKLSNLIPTGLLNSCESLRTPGSSSVPKTNGRNNVTPQQTSRVFSHFTPVTKRPPGPTANSDGKDVRSVKRKRGMEYLSRLQNPAPLVPLGMIRSPRVSKTFNPPRRCETPRHPQTVPIPPPPENKL